MSTPESSLSCFYDCSETASDDGVMHFEDSNVSFFTSIVMTVADTVQSQ